MSHRAIEVSCQSYELLAFEHKMMLSSIKKRISKKYVCPSPFSIVHVTLSLDLYLSYAQPLLFFVTALESQAGVLSTVVNERATLHRVQTHSIHAYGKGGREVSILSFSVSCSFLCSVYLTVSVQFHMHEHGSVSYPTRFYFALSHSHDVPLSFYVYRRDCVPLVIARSGSTTQLRAREVEKLRMQSFPAFVTHPKLFREMETHFVLLFFFSLLVIDLWFKLKEGWACNGETNE